MTNKNLPFLFTVKDGILPQSILKDIIVIIEELELVELNKLTMNSKDSKDRYVLNFDNLNIENEHYKLLDQVNKKIINFSWSCFKKNNNKVEKNNYEVNTIIIRDRKGYELLPHTDSKKKLWTSILYLFDYDYKLGGSTDILISKNKKLVDDLGNKKFSWDLFTTYKKIEPKINRLLFFERTNKSFHGVKRSDIHRLMIIFNCNLKTSA
ncbi:2OG-Fe(II) oxygenase [Alphaproteobacteria bacterium]|nr:2OG-Fe(II) oxygenase [Alphaproteobacteria bacterium]